VNWFELLLLAVVQGFTEFLPISSDGHLIIVEALLGVETDLLELNIMLHAGTLLATIVVYWRRLIAALGNPRLIGLLIVGTLPAVVIGLPLRFVGESILESPLLAGAMLPVSGLLLLIASRRQHGTLAYEDLTWRQALVIGLFQASALLPGVSRSGTTIASGLLVGLRRDAAATFSFLLAVPAVGGACLLETIKLLKQGSVQTPPEMLVAGAAVSFVVGLIALAWLLRWLERGKLHYFAYWLIPLGIAVVAWQLSMMR
jgi:undecaprenyl-diphosphatase